MPIKIRTDLEFGDKWYLKSDVEQLEHALVAVIIVPEGVKFKLSYCGDICEVYDFECSKEPDQMKLLKLRENGDNE